MRTILVKAVLYAYPHLRALAEASEVAACNRAVLSYKDPRPPEEVAERVAREALLACGLKGLADDVAKALGRLTAMERAFVAHKYFKRGEAPVDSRAYYRRQRSAIKRLSRELLSLGWTDERFFELFGTYAPFARLLRFIAEGGDRGLFRNRRRPPVCVREAQMPRQ